MGEIAEMLNDGTLCEQCGVVFDGIMRGEEPPGYPRLCNDCLIEQKKTNKDGNPS